MSLDMKVLSNSEPTILNVAGEIDCFSNALLQRQLEHLCATNSRDILLDLEQVSYLDSMGVRTLLRTHMQLFLQERNLSIRNPSKRVKRVLDVLRLHDLYAGSVDSDTFDHGKSIEGALEEEEVALVCIAWQSPRCLPAETLGITPADLSM